MNIRSRIMNKKGRTFRLSLLSMFLATLLISGIAPFMQLIIVGLSAYFLGGRYSLILLTVAFVEGLAMGQVQTIIRVVDLSFEVTPPGRHLGLGVLLGATLVEMSLLPLLLAKRFLSVLGKRLTPA